MLFLDSSAMVKLYTFETGSEETRAEVAKVAPSGAALITRVEVESALARATRLGVLSPSAAASARKLFHDEWSSFIRVPLTEADLARAGNLTWRHGLRACDAIQLASALIWQELTGRPVTLATFDRQLSAAAAAEGLAAFPVHLG